jgi:hypothetical protein
MRGKQSTKEGSMAYTAQDIREMIRDGNDGNHDAIIDAFKQWGCFSNVRVDGLEVIADGHKLTDEEIRPWLDWCEGITY